MRKRSKTRMDASFPVQFLGDATVGRGTLVNLSGPGCAIASQTVLAPGSYVSLQIKMPTSPTPIVVAVAMVRWAKDDQFGLEFIRYGNGGKAQLAQLMKDHRHTLFAARAEYDGSSE
ncbi:MAG: PilZ domain-containing protein [Nitrospiraceae bacterium]